MDRLADIVAGITAVAMVAVLVTNRNTANVLRAGGGAYAHALSAAMGRGR